MNNQANRCSAAHLAALLGALMFLQSPALAGADDYRSLFGQATSAATGTVELFIDTLVPSYNTGTVYGGPALSTNGGIGVNATSDASDAYLNFSMYAQVGELRNNIVTSSVAAITASPYAISANAWGGSVATWGDRITLSGAYGSTVRMRATIQLDATGSVSPFSLNSSPGYGPIGNSLSYYVALPVVGAMTHTCNDRDGGCSFSQVMEFDVISGTIHGLTASLTLSAHSAAWAGVGVNPLPLLSTTSFQSRGLVYLDVLTPGFSYTMSSGLQLTSPVPEPPIAALMLAGMLLLGHRARQGLMR
jgi:hypothetical protein